MAISGHGDGLLLTLSTELVAGSTASLTLYALNNVLGVCDCLRVRCFTVTVGLSSWRVSSGTDTGKIDTMHSAIRVYVDFYNLVRLHSSLRYPLPMELEQPCN